MSESKGVRRVDGSEPEAVAYRVNPSIHLRRSMRYNTWLSSEAGKFEPIKSVLRVFTMPKNPPSYRTQSIPFGFLLSMLASCFL